MKEILFSTAHVEFAEKNHLSTGADWYTKQWTDEEINLCKKIELQEFISDPCLATFPKADLFVSYAPTEEIQIVSRIIYGKTSFLSVGCGLGEKEVWLAQQHPEITFLAIDNAPYIEGMNAIVKELGLSNILFKRLDLRASPVDKFEVVYSFAVIYCIPDEHLLDYFEILRNNVTDDGIILVGCSSNLHMLLKLAKKLKPGRPIGMKQTGWLRDADSIKNYICEGLHVNKMLYLDHFTFPIFRNFFGKISKYLYPITSAAYLFILSPMQIKKGERS